MHGQPASRGSVRSFAASKTFARSYALARATVRSAAARPFARVGHNRSYRVVRSQPHHVRIVRPLVYRTSYPAAHAPSPVTTTWCADPIVADAWGRAVCSTNGALLVDSSGAVIYLGPAATSSGF